MKHSKLIEESHDDDIIGLKLSAPERDVIATSSRLPDRDLQDRVRSAPQRKLVSFRLEELEDLHRGLAFDANETLDDKRRRTIGNILRKIEDVLDEDDEPDAFDDILGGCGVQRPAPPSAEEFFAAIVGIASPDFQQVGCRAAFTAEERATICDMETISLDIQKMLSVDAPEVRQFDFNLRQFLTLILGLSEAIDNSKDNNQRRSLEQVARSLSQTMCPEDRQSTQIRRPLNIPQGAAYQLKITLQGSKPAIWRRVIVPDCTLAELHETIQVAMGWTNSHLHLFEYHGDQFSDPRFELDGGEYDETQVYLGQLVNDGCQKLQYCYDFGDSWTHVIKIEKILDPKPNERLPKCVKGVGACPPEDCGGIWGYYEFLEAVRDPKHERHAELVDWAGDDFNADAFDVDETNKALAVGLPYPIDDR